MRLSFYILTMHCLLVITAGAQSAEWFGCRRTPPDFLFEYNGNLGADTRPIPSHVTARERLGNFGIPLTENSLLSALLDAKPELRYSAAWQLADDNAKGAIPDIIAALGVERDPRARAYMACALTELGDQRGVQELHRYCDDSTFPVGVRLDVANFLLELGERSCPKVVVEGFLGSRFLEEQAASVMGHFYHASPVQYAELRALLLNNQNGGVKEEALNVMDSLGDVGAIPGIESAIPKQTESWVRGDMERVLHDLQQLAAKPEAPVAKAH
jgi:hypothetical protein